MSIETTIPFSWLRSIPADIKIQDDVPLWGAPPLFPWDAFASELSKILGIPHMSISCQDVQWRAPEDLFHALGENPALHAFSVTPLNGKAYWILPKTDLKKIFQSFLDSEDHSDEWHGEWNDAWEDQFYEFLALQGIQAFHKTPYDSSLSPQILSDQELPITPCLCLDIDIAVYSHTFRTRLAISPEMRLAIKEKYSPKTITFPKGMSEAVTTTLHVTIGSTTILKSEWKNAAPGDFLLLDSCSYSPGDEKGRVVLTVNNTPIFRAKIKDRSLKLLEYPLLQEVQTPMAKQDDDEFDDIFETEDESLLDDEQNLEPGLENELSDEEVVDKGENFDEEEGEVIGKNPSAHPMQGAKDLLNKPSASPVLKPEDIPLTVSVEIARIQMSIQQLMQLAPGNMLDLEITPDNGVDLIVNGHCIGKGELLKLGETLGVRILDKA